MSGRRTRAILMGLVLVGPVVYGASAQEPLFLRIRPSDAAPGAIGRDGLSDAEVARAAHAARETVWVRSAVRARWAIASVCTGCLGPPASPVRPMLPAGAQAAIGLPSDGTAAGAVPAIGDPPPTRGDP
ncbi:hypothetical protein [uncultured Methylobacterium sp.]|uniref:hypothetical protein n=1 Tax=uncultured Methylobacterium sp. TaxID=157278 RepID=UPI0035C95201